MTPALRAAATHLFPGARLAAPAPLPAPPADLIVEFSDGTAAPARILPDLRLEVAGHVTAAGTTIPSKAWALAPDPATGGWRVARRLA
mgnify:CR=1 FL=1